MNETRKNADWPIVVAVATMILLPLGLYVLGYFALSADVEDYSATGEVYTSGERNTVRWYDVGWKALIFQPAARIESLIAGHRVETCAYLPPGEY